VADKDDCQLVNFDDQCGCPCRVLLQLNADGAMNENHAMNELRAHDGGDAKTTTTCTKWDSYQYALYVSVCIIHSTAESASD